MEEEEAEREDVCNNEKKNRSECHRQTKAKVRFFVEKKGEVLEEIGRERGGEEGCTEWGGERNRRGGGRKKDRKK